MSYPQEDFRYVTFGPKAFLYRRRHAVFSKTLLRQLEVLKETGRYDAFKLKRHPNYDEAPNIWPVPNHLFWDSDVAKWIEGAYYCLREERNPEVEAAVHELVEMIGSVQQQDGYLNIHFTVVEPENRFSYIRDLHELFVLLISIPHIRLMAKQQADTMPAISSRQHWLITIYTATTNFLPPLRNTSILCTAPLVPKKVKSMDIQDTPRSSSPFSACTREPETNNTWPWQNISSPKEATLLERMVATTSTSKRSDVETMRVSAPYTGPSCEHTGMLNLQQSMIS